MRSIHIHDKSFDDKDFKDIIIGGQNNADTIRFVVPKSYNKELDLSSWLWAITYENEKGTGDTIYLTAKISSINDENLWIDWKPTATATYEQGRLICQLYAYNASGAKFTTKPFIVYVSEYLNPEPITTPTPTYIEQALTLMAQYNNELEIVRADTAESASNAKQSETNSSKSEAKTLEYKQAVEAMKNRIIELESAAQEAKAAAERAQAQCEAAKEELYVLIGGIPEDFTTVNYRLNDLEACHLENRDDGIHLIVKTEENNG